MIRSAGARHEHLKIRNKSRIIGIINRHQTIFKSNQNLSKIEKLPHIAKDRIRSHEYIEVVNVKHRHLDNGKK